MSKTLFYGLLLLLIAFLGINLYGSNGVSKIPVRDRYFSIDYANYGYQLDTIIITKSASRGNLTITNRSVLTYTTQNYNVIDTIAIVLQYRFPNNNTLYSDSITLALDVLGKANTISNFYAISGPLSATFFNASSSDSVKLNYLWNFGDGMTSTAQEPVHQFAQAGTYNVCLKAFTSVDSNQYCEHILVYDSTFIQANTDVAYFYYPDTAIYARVKDNDLVYGIANVTIVQQGKYGQASVVNGHLRYTLDTFINYVYDVVQYAINNGNVADTGELLVYHYLSPNYPYCQPDFIYSPTLKNVSFTNQIKCTNPNKIVSYLWDFGDSTSSTQINPIHSYSQYGTYRVCLTTEDSFKVVSQTCKHIDVYDNRCQPEFEYTVGINQAAFYSTFNCFDGLAYQWDFGDSNTSTNQFPVHQYATTGTYNVCLTKFGFTDTLTTCKMVTVLDTNAVIAYDDYVVHQYSTNEVEIKVLLNDVFYQSAALSLVNSPSLVNARVSGNQLFIKSKSGVFTGEEHFSYAICRGGVCDTTKVYLTLVPLNEMSQCQPEINYSINGTSVNFDVAANCPAGDSLVAFYWYFSDGDTAMQKQVNHDFKYPGVYAANLTAFDTFGRVAYADGYIVIVDSSINNGNVMAVDDQLSINIFNIGNRYNVVYNDLNLNYKKAYTTLIKDFNHGISIFDTLGHLMWLPDSAYKGCDTMQYAVYSKDNTSVIDTATVFICFEDFTWCVDTFQIDTAYDCGNIEMPVCGCNGITYKNACDAYTRGGVSFYLNGPCSNLLPNLNLNQSSSRISMYNDEKKELGYTVNGSNVKNLSIELAAVKDNNKCLNIRHDKLRNLISIEPCADYTGLTKFYTTVCDDFGACKIDTFYVNVQSRKSTALDVLKYADFSVFPNPATQQLNITTLPGESYHYILSNLQGVMLSDGNFEGSASLDITQFSEGLYILSIYNNEGTLLKVEKVIKN